jgi:hypothetical protein
MIFNQLYKKTIFVKKQGKLYPIGITKNKEYHVYKPWQDVKIFFNLKNAILYSLKGK